MNPFELNAALARAFGLPEKTRRAVITLEAGEAPKIAIECFEMPLRIIDDVDGIKRLAAIEFMIRLEPFPTTTKDVTT